MIENRLALLPVVFYFPPSSTSRPIWELFDGQNSPGSAYGFYNHAQLQGILGHSQSVKITAFSFFNKIQVSRFKKRSVLKLLLSNPILLCLRQFSSSSTSRHSSLLIIENRLNFASSGFNFLVNQNFSAFQAIFRVF